MGSELLAAGMGACATLIAGAIPLAANAIANRRAKHLSARRGVLLGRWEGRGTDYYVEDSAQPRNLQFSVEMTYTAVGHTVKAHAVLTGSDATQAADHVALVGMFYNDDYLQLSYHNENFARKQPGVVVLGLGPNGDILKGYYAGFSPRRSTIVAGTIEMTKKA